MTVAFVRGMTTSRVTLMLAMIVLLLSSLVAAPIAAQTTSGSFTFDGGQTLTWGDDWELDEESVELEDGVESALFFRGVSVLSVLTVPNDFDLNEGRDIFLDAFLEAVGESVTIDRGSYGQVSYSLDLVNSAGFESGVFTLFRAGSGATPTFAYVFFAEVSEFAAEFASAQTTFLLDGEGLFDGVAGQGLQDLLVANTGSAPPAPAEPPAGTGDPDDVRADDEPEDPDSSGLKDRDGQDGGLETAETSFDDDVAQTWNEEIFGYSIDWMPSWIATEEGGESTIVLTSVESESLVVISGFSTNGESANVIFERLSNSFEDGLFDTSIMLPVSQTDDRILLAAYEGDSLVVQEGFVIDGGRTLILAVFGTSVQGLDESVEEYRTGVLIDGKQPMLFWDEINSSRNVLDNAVSGEDRYYVSPQFGIELVWGDSWQFDDVVGEPTVSEVAAGIDTVYIASVDPGAFITVTLADANITTASGVVAYWQTDEYVQGLTQSASAEVVLSDSSRDIGAVVIRDVLEDGREVLVIREVHMVDGIMVTIQYLGLPDYAETLLPNAQTEILLDGQPVLDFFTAEEVLDEF